MTRARTGPPRTSDSKVFDPDRQEWVDQRTEFEIDRELSTVAQRRMRYRALWTLIGVGLVFAVWPLFLDEPKQPDDADPAPTISAVGGSGTDAEPPADLPSEPVSALPDGFEVVTDDEGFRIAVPVGWERESRPSQVEMAVVDYHTGDDVNQIRIFAVKEWSPEASLTEAKEEDKRIKDEYSEMEPSGSTEWVGNGAAHEYRFRSESGDLRHVIDHRFTAEDGNNYALIVSGSYDDGVEDETLRMDTAAAWFCPPQTECASPSS